MKKIIVILSFIGLFSFVLLFNEQSYSQLTNFTANAWKGVASYYHPKFNGRKTSNGETFSNTALTCANNFLRLGTYILVTNLQNGKAVIVKVNDRMHPRNKRLIDLSQAAAAKIGLIHQGVGQVSIQVLGDEFNSNIALN